MVSVGLPFFVCFSRGGKSSLLIIAQCSSRPHLAKPVFCWGSQKKERGELLFVSEKKGELSLGELLYNELSSRYWRGKGVKTGKHLPLYCKGLRPAVPKVKTD